MAQRGNACCGSHDRELRERTFSRVGVLGAGLVAAAGGLGWNVSHAAAAETVQVWGLDPDWAGDPSGCGCSACNSCRAHAGNKLFASAAEADSGRAHPFCKCLVVPLVVLDRSVYATLFLDGGRRPSVDRRYQWVQAVLAQVPAAHDEGGVAARSGVPDTSVRALLRRSPFQRGADGTRTIALDVEADEIVTATIVITRNGAMLAHKAVAGVTGRRRLRLVIPSGAAEGPARLRLKFRNSAGNSKVVTRGIRIPHAKRSSARHP